MPQLMPLFWAFSNLILLMIMMLLAVLYSFSYLGLEISFGVKSSKIVSWYW